MRVRSYLTKAADREANQQLETVWLGLGLKECHTWVLTEYADVVPRML